MRLTAHSDTRFAAGVRRLRAAGVPDPVDEMRRIMRWAARAGAGQEAIEHAIDRRARREPFSHIVGQRSFWKLDFEVSPAVLDPRPESETLVDTVLLALSRAGRQGPLRILDLGTGSGCLLLSLLNELPEAHGIGVDCSLDAILVAQRNARRCGLEARCGWAAGDWTAALGARFDIVISNPPYIESRCILGLDPEVRNSEPRLALDGGPDGLGAFRRIVPSLTHCLEPDGFVCLEFGPGQAEPVQCMLHAAGLQKSWICHDLDGRPRCVLAWSTTSARRPAGAAGAGMRRKRRRPVRNSASGREAGLDATANWC